MIADLGDNASFVILAGMVLVGYIAYRLTRKPGEPSFPPDGMWWESTTTTKEVSNKDES